MKSVDPTAHRRVDSALRDLRGLDRTINQDVLRARFRLVNSYHSVLQSYRQIDALEAVLAKTPDYLGKATVSYREAVVSYRRATTRKQRIIEHFKYASAHFNSLLKHLAGASEGVSRAAMDSGEHELAQQVHRVEYLTLLYVITSNYSGASDIKSTTHALKLASETSASRKLRVRVRTFCRDVLRLLELKPNVDELLRQILDEPIAQHELRVTNIYYRGYAAAESRASTYRLALYGFSLALLAAVAFVLLRLRSAAIALSDSNDQLEARVLQRTEELDAQHQELKTVLDNVGQALFTVDADGAISTERSAKLDEWLPEAFPGTKFWDLIEPIDIDDAAWIEAGWTQLAQDVMPPSVILSQLPEFLETNGCHYQVDYREIFDSQGKTERILVVLSDVTDRIEGRRREAAQQEQFKVFQHFLHDRSAFMEFISDGDTLIYGFATGETDSKKVFRAVHTLKGNCGLFGVQSIANICHKLESELERDGLAPAIAQQKLADAWGVFRGRLEALTGEGNYKNTVRLHVAAIDRLKLAIVHGAPSEELLSSIARMQREPVRGRLSRLGDHARAVAGRQGKGNIEIHIEDGGVRLDVARWSPFWAASVHLLRNAADHGLEEPGDRLALGKSEFGNLTLRTRYVAGHIVVEFEDDGQGIDWQALLKKAQKTGLIAVNDGGDDRDQEQLQNLLFTGGISTKKEATDTSGRGVGVSAAFAACRDLGGRAEIDSVQGKGSLFRFTIPDDDSRSPRPSRPDGLKAISV